MIWIVSDCRQFHFVTAVVGFSLELCTSKAQQRPKLQGVFIDDIAIAAVRAVMKIKSTITT